MYNYQQHIRDQRIRQKSEQLQQSFLRQSHHRKLTNIKMKNHHQKKINTFLLSVLEKPIEVRQYRDPRFQPRPINPANRTSQSMRLNSQTTAQRIKDIQNKHSFLDEVPFNNASNHKFRQSPKGKNLKPFKLSSSATAVRLYDHLLKNRTNQVDVSLSQKTHALVTRNDEIFFQSRKSSHWKQKSVSNPKKQLLMKTLMPSLHRKTFFTSVQNLLVDRHSCKANKTGNNLIEKSKNKGQGAKCPHKQSVHFKQDKQNSGNKKKESLKGHEKEKKGQSAAQQHIGIRESAMEALTQCNIIHKPLNSFHKQAQLKNYVI